MNLRSKNKTWIGPKLMVRLFNHVSMVLTGVLLALGGTSAVLGQSLTDAEALEDVQAIESAIEENLERLEQATICLQAGRSSGSAVIVSADGLILTAAHVVEGQETMTVRFSDNRSVECKVLGTYGPADAAMAKIIDEGVYVYAKMAKAKTIRRGSTVIAMGNPNGFDFERGMPLRVGHIHATQPNFFTTDAALIRGDSGGPSFNLKGEVIGIHSNVGRSVTENNDIRIDVFYEHWDSLLSGARRGKVLQPESAPEQLVVGMQLLLPTPGQPVRVNKVVADTPAAWAGVKAGDKILTVNDVAIDDSITFLHGAKLGQWGSVLNLHIVRQQQELDLRIELLTYDQIQAEKKNRTDASQTPSPSIVDEPTALPRPSEQQKDESDDNGGENRENRDSDEGDENDDDNEGPTPVKPPVADSQPAVDRKSELKRLLAEARKNGGRLKIDRKKLLELNNRLSKRMDKLSPVGGRMNDRWSRQFQQAFLPQAELYGQSVFPVIVTGRVSAVAVAVSDQGHFITKASEVEGRRFQIVIRDDLRLDATVVATDDANDLVLLKADPAGASLRPVDFVKDGALNPVKGTVVCCVGGKQDALTGFGVVSCAARALDGASGAILGVTSESVEQGVKILQSPEFSPAGIAGLKPDDIIIDFDGQPVKEPSEITDRVAKHLPDEEVRVTVVRGEDYLSVVVKLGSRSKLAPMAGSSEQDLDRDAAKLSRRRWLFTQGFQHDCAIRPRDCGGLLVDLRGKIVGLNISRSGRVKSYALPASLVATFVQQSISQ